MEEIMICPFCGRDDIYRKCSFTLHVNRCKENPDKVEVSKETRNKMSEAHKGKTLSDETKLKLSETLKGRTFSDETKQKLSETRKGRQPHKGKKHSDESRKKISEAKKGQKLSDESKQKISEANKGKTTWNKGITLSYAFKQKMSEAISSPEVQQKIYNTKKQNNSFNSSKIEEQLKEYFITNNINFKTQYKSDKYPFMSDFYFPDKDLYVEIQGTWTHGGKPFDASDIGCINQLALWKSKNKPFYLNAIDTWTNRDVRKRNYAKEHKLNWIEIFSDNLNECLEIIMKLL